MVFFTPTPNLEFMGIAVPDKTNMFKLQPMLRYATASKDVI